MKRSFRLLAILFTCLRLTDAGAQNRQYTMAEAVNGMAGVLAPKGVKYPSWQPGTHRFHFVADGRVMEFDAEKGSVDTGSTVADWNKKFYRGAAPASPFIEVKWIDKAHSYAQVDSSLVIFTGQERHVIGMPAKAANIVPIPCADCKQYAAATVDNNLILFGEGERRKVTSDTNPNIISGQAVHRNEFGIDRGIFFSPKGAYLAYYRMDQTMVEDYPVIDWSVTPARNENVKYPMAGRRSHEVTVQVYNIATGKTTAINTEGPKDQYLTCVTWSPDEAYIYIAVLNRDQNHLWLNQYDAKTGNKVKTILQEQDDKYVEPQHPLAFLPGSTTQFIWWSQRDGYMHLWLCDMAKNSMRCLTPGAYVVNDLLGFNAKRRDVLLTSAEEDPREKHGYAVNWETGKMRRLDKEPGTHNYLASDDGEYLFDVFSAEPLGIVYMDRTDTFHSSIHILPRDIPSIKNYPQFKSGDTDKWNGVAKRSIIRDIQGRTTKILMNSANPLKDYSRPTVKNLKIFSGNAPRYLDKTGKFIADDTTSLFGKLILPTNFDPARKYPVIVYLYNGPHVQLIKNGFPESGNLWYEYLAQHGYIVWTMDGRGSSNRGQKFEQAVFRKLGTVEMEDQLKGVEFLRSLPYVDTARMGVHGWSFGGFMTTSLMLRHPGVFKVGVAGGPVMDWKMYEIMYGERYMDTPEQNPEGYNNSVLFDKVKNLQGKLLLIHGAQDATVVWQHSINFLKAAVDAGKQVDYFVYPGYEHNVRGKDRVHLMQKVTDYFDEYLK